MRFTADKEAMPGRPWEKAERNAGKILLRIGQQLKKSSREQPQLQTRYRAFKAKRVQLEYYIVSALEYYPILWLYHILTFLSVSLQ